MDIDVDRLKWDREYWDGVAPKWAVGAFEIELFTGHDIIIFGSGRVDVTHDKGVELYYRVVSAIPRPAKPEPKEWDGEGLPPVGCECECWTGDEWILGQSVGPYLGGWLCMLTNNIERPFVGSEGDFRPIRTQAERKREELALSLQNGIEAITGDKFDDTDALVLANDLMAAGYRKGEK